MTHNPECGLDCVSAGAVRLDNKAKHTPGPWRVCTRSAWRIRDASDNTVSCTGNDSALAGKHEADARLIAAAPEMYEALKDAHRVLTKAGMSDAIDLDYIEEVLAKAEGRDR